MGIRFTCDGCDGDLDQTQARKRGWYSSTFYCADCDQSWKALEAQMKELQVAAAKQFEASWAEKKRLVKENKILLRLPDDE